MTGYCVQRDKVLIYKKCGEIIFWYESSRCAIYQWYILTPS